VFPLCIAVISKSNHCTQILLNFEQVERKIDSKVFARNKLDKMALGCLPTGQLNPQATQAV
jgi:hypothetical protein